MTFGGVYHDWNQKRIRAFVEHYGHQFFFKKKVLDLGSGHGDISGVLYRLGADVTAVDARQEHLKIIDKKYNGVKVIRADLDQPWPFFRKTFDLTLDLGLLCHLHDFEQHLKAVCASTNFLILETAVLDSNNIHNCSVKPDSKGIYDGSFNGFSSQISAANIERVLTENGMSFDRMDKAKFNSGPYKYDWASHNNDTYDFNKRRIWFCVRNGSTQVFNNTANILPPVNIGNFSSHLLDSKVPINHKYLMTTSSPQPPNQQNKYTKSWPTLFSHVTPPLTLSAIPGSRDFLIYITGLKDVYSTELFGSNRLFDVAYNDYTGSHIIPEQAEYKYSINEWKYEFVKHHLLEVVLPYKAVAFLDDDIQVSTEDINRLFIIGTCLNFNIWHPAYSLECREECHNWEHIKQRKNSLFRETNLIELNATFFSQYALQKCIDTFDFNCSGIGLEQVWMKLLQPNPRNFIVDAIPMIHTRAHGMRKGVNGKGYPIYPNGLNWQQEVELVYRKGGVRLPKKIY